MKLYNSKSNTFFDINFCIMSLNCTSSQFNEALRQYNEHRLILPALRDFLHEHAHHIQSATTTVGYYLTLLQHYQIHCLRACTQYILDDNQKVYPLFHNILDVNTHEVLNKKAAHRYYYWALCELVRLHLWGDRDQIDYYLTFMMQGDGLFDYYAELEDEFRRIYGLPKNHDIQLISNSKNIRKIFLGSEFIKQFAEYDLNSIFESEALLAEYWFDQVADERLLQLLDKQSFSKEYGYYIFPLILFKSGYNLDLSKKNDFLSFKLGFHAICQIVLNSPMMPYQGKKYLLTEIDIVNKFIMLVTYCRIPLPRSLEDYRRFIEEVIQEYQLKSLDENYRELKENEHLLMNRLLSPSLFKEEVFISAQNMYNKDPLNYYLFLNGTYSTPDMFTIKFTDTELDYPSNKMEYLISGMLTQYYKELLYGYNAGDSEGNIKISTPVRFSKSTMDLVKDTTLLFNIGLQALSPDLPSLTIYNAEP